MPIYSVPLPLGLIPPFPFTSKVSCALRMTDTDYSSSLPKSPSGDKGETGGPDDPDLKEFQDEIESYDGLQNAIAEELKMVLDRCCFKVNQRMLLRDLFLSNIASPFLLAPAVVSQAASGSLLIPATTLSPNGSGSAISQPAAGTNTATPTPDPTGTGTGVNKLKSNVFNNSVPPRRRPPIPSLSVLVKKDPGSGVGIGDVPPVPPIALVAPPLAVAAPTANPLKVLRDAFHDYLKL